MVREGMDLSSQLKLRWKFKHNGNQRFILQGGLGFLHRYAFRKQSRLPGTPRSWSWAVCSWYKLRTVLKPVGRVPTGVGGTVRSPGFWQIKNSTLYRSLKEIELVCFVKYGGVVLLLGYRLVFQERKGHPGQFLNIPECMKKIFRLTHVDSIKAAESDECNAAQTDACSIVLAKKWKDFFYSGNIAVSVIST